MRQRVRRNWWALSHDERDSYIRGLIKLRENGFNGVESAKTDEFARMADVHVSSFGGIVHDTSHFFFWHSYLLWEMESRIRNLGGEWACFAMPYWDFWTTTRKFESKYGFMFQGAMGGGGEPDNGWRVETDWPYSTEQFWVPYHCNGEGEEAPLCSFKRSLGNFTQMAMKDTGRMFMDHPKFYDMQMAFANYQNYALIVRKMFAWDDSLHSPSSASYDPIWWMFHSMISYQQYLWEDCNEYDRIEYGDLDDHPEAYTPFLNTSLSGLEYLGISPDMSLDAELYYGSRLENATWSWVHNNKLTVRKLYHLHRWNVIYDLGDGSGFFKESGLDEYCDDTLNPDWFQFSTDHVALEEREQAVEGHAVRSVAVTRSVETVVDSMLFLVFLGVVVLVVGAFKMWWSVTKKTDAGLVAVAGDGTVYGAV